MHLSLICVCIYLKIHHIWQATLKVWDLSYSLWIYPVSATLLSHKLSATFSLERNSIFDSPQLYCSVSGGQRRTTVWRCCLWNGVGAFKYAVICSYCARLGRFGYSFSDPVVNSEPCLYILGDAELLNKNVVKQIVNNLRCIIRPQLPPSLRRDYSGFWMLGPAAATFRWVAQYHFREVSRSNNAFFVLTEIR